MKLDERHLVQLAAVVTAGGVTEGAALLGMAQPAVSRTIATLEKRLGQPLFIRGRRPLQPTPLGRALSEHGQVMLSALRKASQTASGFMLGRSGSVRVGGTPFFMDGLMAELIARFQRSYPDVRIDQSYGYFTDLIGALRADQIDLAMCPVDLLDEGSGFGFQEILPGRNVVACRLTHPLVLKRHVAPSDLLDQPWIAPPPGSPLLADLRAMLLAFGATEIRIRYSGGSLMSVLNYLRNADALTILPHSVVFNLARHHPITALPVAIPHPPRALAILHSLDAPRAPAVEHFALYVQQSFNKLKDEIRRHEDTLVGPSSSS